MYDYNAESLRLTPEARAVSAEDAPGLQAAADRITERHRSAHHLQDLPRQYSGPHDLEVNYAGLDLHCYASPANEQLSRDLIDAARDAKGG